MMASTKLKILPELILQIFLHLPTKSLKRLICVLDDHPDLAKELQTSWFRNKHALKMMSDHANEHLMIPSKRDGDNIYVFDPTNALLAGGIDPRYEFKQLFKDILPYETETLMCCMVIGACNGLVCLFFEFYTLPRWKDIKGGGCRCCVRRAQRKSTYHFVLWNPFTGENHVLPTPQGFRFNLKDYSFVPPTICGFGYDVVNDTYKIVLGEETVTKFYDLSTNMWESIDNEITKIDNWCDFDYYKHGLYPFTMAQFGHYLNGNLYWIVSKTVIVSIDLSTGVSTRLELPHCCSSEPYDHVVNMGVLKGCRLTVACFRGREKEVGIWVLEEDGGREALWTNMFTVESISSQSSTYVRPPLWISKDEEMMLFLLDDKLGCWNSELNEFTYVENFEINYTNRGILHIDTLVSPKPENYHREDSDNNKALATSAT